MFLASSEDYKILHSRSKCSFLKIVPIIDKVILNEIGLSEIESDISTIERILNHATNFTMSIDADSDIRRTGTLTLSISKDDFSNIPLNTWMNVTFSIFIGYSYTEKQNINIDDSSIRWYQQGVFKIVEKGYSFNETTNEVTLSLADLVVMYNGERNGYLKASSITIDVSENNTITEVITSLIIHDIEKADVIGYEYGTTSYYGEDEETKFTTLNKAYITVPYSIDITSETTRWNVIKELKSLYPAWDAFFNEEGRFVLCKIPCSDKDRCSIEITDDLLVDEQGNESISDYYNHTIIYCSDIIGDVTATSATMSVVNNNETISLALNCKADECNLSNFIITFTVIEGKKNEYENLTFILNFEDGTTCTAWNFNSIPTGSIKKDGNYAIRYSGNLSSYGTVEFLGETSPVVGEYRNTHPDSLLNISKCGDVLQTLSGDDYDDIFDRTIAQERAQYETWKSSQSAESKTIVTTIIPQLTVNQKVLYKGNEYIVKNISRDYLATTDTIQLSAFYPLYQYSDIQAGQIRTAPAIYRDYLGVKIGKMNGYSYKNLQEEIIV